jgi:hypothetical protein
MDRLIEMSYSDDNGHSWSNWRPRSLGEVGEYDTRVRWHRLGAARNRRFRFRVSGPIRANVIAVQVQIEPTR